WFGLERVMHDRPLRGILARAERSSFTQRRVIAIAHRRLSRVEECLSVLDLRRALAQWCEIVEDPDGTPVGADDEIIVLDGEVGDGDGRQIELEMRPGGAVVPRDEQATFAAEIEQSLAPWILTNDVQIAVGGQLVAQCFPRCAEIGRLEQERPAVVKLV